MAAGQPGGFLHFTKDTLTDSTTGAQYSVSLVATCSLMDWHGIYVLSGSEWTRLTSENSGIAGERIFGVMIDDSDRVWIGSSGGVSVAALPEARPLPGTVVSWHRAVLYIQSWFDRGYWFFPTIVAVLWLATYFNALPGVVVGLTVIGVGVGIDLVGKSAYGMLVYVGAIVTIGGMLGGFVGGLIERRRKNARSLRWDLEMAIFGMLMGIGYCLYLWLRIMAGKGRRSL